MPTMASPSASAAKNPSRDRKSTRLNSSHLVISYAVFCLKKKDPQGSPCAAWLHDTSTSVGSQAPDFVPSSRRSVRNVFFFNDTATTEIYTLSLHDALPICVIYLGAVILENTLTTSRLRLK